MYSIPTSRIHLNQIEVLSRERCFFFLWWLEGVASRLLLKRLVFLDFFRIHFQFSGLSFFTDFGTLSSFRFLSSIAQFQISIFDISRHDIFPFFPFFPFCQFFPLLMLPLCLVLVLSLKLAKRFLFSLPFVCRSWILQVHQLSCQKTFSLHSVSAVRLDIGQ